MLFKHFLVYLIEYITIIEIHVFAKNQKEVINLKNFFRKIQGGYSICTLLDLNRIFKNFCSQICSFLMRNPTLKFTPPAP